MSRDEPYGLARRRAVLAVGVVSLIIGVVAIAMEFWLLATSALLMVLAMGLNYREVQRRNAQRLTGEQDARDG